MQLDNFMCDPDLEGVFNKAIGAILPESLQLIWSEMKDLYDPFIQKVNKIFKNQHLITSLMF